MVFERGQQRWDAVMVTHVFFTPAERHVHAFSD